MNRVGLLVRGGAFGTYAVMHSVDAWTTKVDSLLINCANCVRSIIARMQRRTAAPYAARCKKQREGPSCSSMPIIRFVRGGRRAWRRGVETRERCCASQAGGELRPLSRVARWLGRPHRAEVVSRPRMNPQIDGIVAAAAISPHINSTPRAWRRLQQASRVQDARPM